MRWKISLFAILLMVTVSFGAAGKEFKWAGFTDAISMDPYNVNETFTLGFTNQIYDGLVTRGKNLEILPALAVSWSNPSPTKWLIKLRQGVKFHNGNPFNSDDVIFSYQRVNSKGSDMKGNFALVEDIKATGPYTIKITTKGPYPILLSQLSTWWIMDKEWAEANNATEVTDIRTGTENFAHRNANGTGPFMLVSRQADVKTVLKRNPDWWGWSNGLGNSNITLATMTPIKQDATRIAAILSGDVDFMYPVPVQDIGRLKRAGIDVLQGPELRVIYLGMDIARDELLESSVKGSNPFKDYRVRLALYKAINVDLIVKKIMKGVATPARGMVVKGVTGYDGTFQRMSYDPNASRALLAKAGYPNGFEVGFDCPNDRYVNDEQICQAVVSMWAKIGIKAKLNAQTKSLYFKKALSRNTSTYLLGWSPGTVDGHNVLQNLIMTPNKAEKVGRFNLGGYSNKRVDALTRLSAAELDTAKRTRMLKRALNLAHWEVGTIPLHYQQVVWAARSNVSVVQLASNFFQLRWAVIK